MEIYRKLIEKGESERVEFKKGYEKESVAMTVCAFANREGGVIFIGVSDDGKIEGVKNASKLVYRISQDISGLIEPSLNPSVKIVEIDDREVIVVEVPVSPIKPVSVRGRFYIRTGSSNRLMGIHEICDLYSQSTSKSWDTRVVDEATEDDIDLAKVEDFLRLIERRRPGFSLSDPLEFLKKKQLIKNSKPTNAALLLFGKDPQIWFPSRMVQIIIYAKSRTFPDVQIEVSGTIPEMIERSYEEILRLIATKLVISGLQNVQVYGVPEEALREGLINALVHRDWGVPSPVYVEISPEGVKIANPGVIPPPLNEETIKLEEHYSVLRNPKIGEILYDGGYIERYGSGTLRILRSYAGERETPDWKVSAGRTILFLPMKLRDVKSAIIGLMRGKPFITAKEVAESLSISLNTARKYLKLLVKEGKLKEMGKTKGRVYLPPDF